MIAAEMKIEGATIRIHDEYCENVSQESMLHLSQIITDSYKRRKLKDNDVHKEGCYRMQTR